MSDLIGLPEATLAHITSFLDVRALLSFSVTCRRVHQFVVSNDLLLWGARCAQSGIDNLTSWSFGCYRDLYSNLLHPHKKLLGVWTSKVPPYGSVLVVHLQAPVIIGSCLVNKKLNEPVQLRPVFEIRCETGKQPQINCLRTIYRPQSESTEQPEKHEAQLVVPADGCSFKLSCCEGCKQDEFELEVRKNKQLPEGTYTMEGPMVNDGSSSSDSTLEIPEIADVEPEDDAEMVLQMLNMAMLELYRKDTDPTTPTFSRLLLPTTQSHALEGLWKGTYGPHGIETLLVVVEDDQLIGTKLTGDYNVPAGEITFKADLPSRAEPSATEQKFILPRGVIPRVDAKQLAQSQLPVIATYEAEGQVARPGFHSPSFINAKLLQFSDDCFGILWLSIHTFSLFKRLPLPHLGSSEQNNDSAASPGRGTAPEAVAPEPSAFQTFEASGGRHNEGRQTFRRTQPES